MRRLFEALGIAGLRRHRVLVVRPMTDRCLTSLCAQLPQARASKDD
jgi:hypothetical protein